MKLSSGEAVKNRPPQYRSIAFWDSVGRGFVAAAASCSVRILPSLRLIVLPTFHSDGVEIAFMDEGTGPSTLLIHGFASNHRVNWVSTSWVGDLLAAGRRVIAFDDRGHGESGKPHEPDAYRLSTMAEDARRLLDHLSVERTAVIGYSLGSWIAARLAILYSERVSSLALGGVGDALMRRELFDEPDAFVSALRAPSLDAVNDDRGRAYRAFADRTRSDREALVACILGARERFSRDDLGKIDVPVLVTVGSEDKDAGSAERLAAMMPRGEAFVIPGRDHMKAVGDRAHKAAVFDFLKRHGG